MGLEPFFSTSIADLTKARVAKLIILKAAVAFVVVEGGVLFPALRQFIFRHAGTRSLMQWARPSVVVAELLRIGLHVGILKVLEGRAPAGRFPSFQHLSMFFDASWQSFIPKSIRGAVSYVPLETNAVLGVYTSLTHTEIVASVIATTAGNLATWISCAALKKYQGTLPHNAFVTSLQIGLDTTMIAAVHYATLSLAARYAPRSNLNLYMLSWAGAYAFGAFSCGAICALSSSISSAVINKLTGLGQPLDIPTENLERLKYLSSFSAPELLSFLELANYVMNGPFDNNIRLHLAKLVADVLTYQNAVMRDLVVKKRTLPLHSVVDTFRADMIANPDDAVNGIECLCGCSQRITLGSNINVFSCGHMIRHECEADYPYEWCRGCPVGATVVVHIPDDAREAMQQHVQHAEQSLMERWYSICLLPDYLLFRPWAEVAAYARRHKLASDFELSVFSGEAQPQDGSGIESMAELFLLALDVSPSEWNPMVVTTAVV